MLVNTAKCALDRTLWHFVIHRISCGDSQGNTQERGIELMQYPLSEVFLKQIN